MDSNQSPPVEASLMSAMFRRGGCQAFTTSPARRPLPVEWFRLRTLAFFIRSVSLAVLWKMF